MTMLRRSVSAEMTRPRAHMFEIRLLGDVLDQVLVALVRSY